MGKLLEDLRQYFENTSQEVLDRDREALQYLNEIGPDVMEYAKQYSVSPKCEIPDAKEQINSSCKYYLVA